VHLLPSLPHQHLLFPSRDQDCATASFLVLSWLTAPTPRPWAFRVAAVPGLRARPSPGPDSGLDGPGCLSAGLVPLAVQWPPAHAVVWPFGWHTLGVSGHGERAVRRTPGPYTGRIEGPRARRTPDRSSSPAGGDCPAVTLPETSFALNPVPAGSGGFCFRCAFLSAPGNPRLRAAGLRGGSAALLRVRLIHVQILRLQQFSIHLRIRPIYQEHAIGRD
jgi:hypothetical protein